MASQGERESKKLYIFSTKLELPALLDCIALPIVLGPSIAEGLIQYWSVHIGDITML